MGFLFQSSGLNKIPERLDKFGELFTECFHSLLFQKSTNTIWHVGVNDVLKIKYWWRQFDQTCPKSYYNYNKYFDFALPYSMSVESYDSFSKVQAVCNWFKNGIIGSYSKHRAKSKGLPFAKYFGGACLDHLNFLTRHLMYFFLQFTSKFNKYLTFISFPFLKTISDF